MPRGWRGPCGDVLRQSLSDIEVIIADDASTDGTEKWSGEFQRKRPEGPLPCTERQQRGHAGCPQQGVAMAARGAVRVFLDSDDELDEHTACKSRQRAQIDSSGPGGLRHRARSPGCYERTGTTAPSAYYPPCSQARGRSRGSRGSRRCPRTPSAPTALTGPSCCGGVPFRRGHALRGPRLQQPPCTARRGRFAVVPWVVDLPLATASAEGTSELERICCRSRVPIGTWNVRSV
ncbi:glycosyltransferase [Streptosporangium vulgare]|uniref:glycosyltransferase n=1 Tax=Streptosporangium vulgare TaxID=46190 RepID=UPI003CD08723